MTPLAKYLTVQEASLALGVSNGRVRQLLKFKKLPTVLRQIGRRPVTHTTGAAVTKRIAKLAQEGK